MNQSRRIVPLLLCLAVCTVIRLSPAYSQTTDPATRAKIFQLFQKGLDFFDTGQYKEAAAIFDQILELRPDSSTALELREKAGTERLMKMLTNETVESAVRHILELAEKKLVTVETPPDKIIPLVNDLGSEDMMTRWKAIRSLIAVGEYAVPYLLKPLDTKGPNIAKTSALITLRGIGPNAVLPLIEALKAPSDLVRQNVIAVLGHIGDSRAVPALKALYTKDNEPAFIKDLVKSSMIKLTGQVPEALLPAETYYYKLAEQFYYSDPDVIGHPYDKVIPIWVWENNGNDYSKCLTHKKVPRYAYNNLMAEKLCFDGLAANPGCGELIELLVSNYFAQINECNMLLAGKLRGLDGAKLSAEERAEIQKRRQGLQKAYLTYATAGKKYVYASLRRALRDKDASLAHSCLTVLRALENNVAPTSSNPIVSALAFPDKLVRYQAAETLVHVSPDGRLGGVKAAMKLFADALSEDQRRAILISTPDLSLANALAGEFRTANFEPIHVEGDVATLTRAKQGYPSIDVIVLSVKGGKGSSPEKTLKLLKRDLATAQTPVVLLAPKSVLDEVKQTCGSMAEAVMALDTRPELVCQKIKAILRNPAFSLDEKANARKLILTFSRTILEVDPNHTSYPLAQIVPEFVALSKQKDNRIRLAAIRALGHIGDRAGVNAVADIFSDASAPKNMRLAAADAMGRILMRSGTVTESEYGVLKAALSENDKDIRRAASLALGRAGLTADKITSIAVEQQVILW